MSGTVASPCNTMSDLVLQDWPRPSDNIPFQGTE